MKKIFAIITAVSMFAQMGITALADSSSIYVSPNGSSGGTGTLADPVNSLEKAKSLAKNKGASQIIFKEGTYKIDNTVIFDDTDIGTYKAEGEVIFSGAEQLESAAFKQVTDPEILQVLPQNAKTKVLQYDLSQNGIRYSLSDAVRPYLYADDVMQTTARYPNSGFLTAGNANGTASFTYTSYDISKWANAKDAVAVGSFPYSYYWRNWDMSVSGNTITLDGGTEAAKARQNAEFYVENLIEELDTAGEYFVDRENNILYYYPTGNILSQKIEITAFLDDAIKMTDSKNITFDGITFDKIGGNAFDITDAENVNIKNCTIKNIQGDDAIYLRGNNSKISDNLFYACANNVIEIHGGDVRSLQRGNIEVTNNKISLCGFRGKHTVITSGSPAGNRTYDYANKINNNLIQDCMTFMGIECNAYDYEIMYNEILNQGYHIGDGGAVYMGRSTVKYGTEVAYNYIHDGNKDAKYPYAGLYSDDANAGVNLHHNVIKDMYQGFITGVGMDTKINDNLLINNMKAAGIGSRLTQLKDGKVVEHAYVTSMKENAELIVADTAYTDAFWRKYPQIRTALNRTPYSAPWDMEIKGNVAIGGEGVTGGAYHLYKYNSSDASSIVTGEAARVTEKGYNPTSGSKYIGSTSVTGLWIDNEIVLYGADVADNGTTKGNPTLVYNESYFENPGAQDYTLTNAFSSDVSTVNQIKMSEIGIQSSTNSAITAEPTTVELTAPANGAVNVDTKTTFAWNRVKDASKYRIIISTNDDLSNPVKNEIFADTSNALMKEYTLSADTTYYWQVEAAGIAKGGSFQATSGINSFTTKASNYVNKENLTYAVSLLEKEIAEYEAGNTAYKDETIGERMKTAKDQAASAATQSAVDAAETAILSVLADAKKSAYTENEIFTVAFLGGSLTEGGSEWIADTKAILEEKMPGKMIRTINAGKGGTQSNYGAARFSEDIAKYAPDMVFVDFAVNDTGVSEVVSKVYMESIVRQCKELPKEPVVIFLYTPHPVEKGSDTYTSWLSGVNWKEEVAEHYGIKSINIYDYMQADYEAIQTAEGYTSFTDYLVDAGYQDNGNGGFDVHAGYGKYGEAIVKEFTENYNECMSPMKDVGIYCDEQYRYIVNAEYNQIAVDSSRLIYTGNWQTYTDSNRFTTDDGMMTMNTKFYSYPFFPNGIKQVVNEAAEVKFTTSADRIYLNHVSATAGSAAKVFIDGADSGETVTCYSQYHNMNYIGNYVDLPGDGKEHTVELKVEAPTASNYVFRFGSIVEWFFGGAQITHVSADRESDNITVTAEGFNAGEEVSVMVTNPNYDKNAAADSFDLSAVQYTDTLKADDEGVVSFVFNTRVENEDRSGNYTLYIGTKDGEVIAKTYNYGIISVGNVTYKAGNIVITDLSEYAGEKVTMYCPIENNTGKDINPAIITAVYADGKLVDSYLDDSNKVGKAEKRDAVWTVTLPADFTDVTDARVFFWESMQTLKPLSKARVIYEVK